jgi:hypothetical protein
MLKNILLLFFLLPIVCGATDLKPWYGYEYEFEMRATFLYQNFDQISSCNHLEKHTENDGFLTLSVAYPFKRYCCEFEATVADTRVQNYRWDNFRITGRFQFLGEIYGNYLTAVAGLILDEPLSQALHDVSSFHHGHINGEAFLSFGKEYDQFRWWTIVGLGTADRGSAWVHEDVAFEYLFEESHLFRGFVHTLWGMGKNKLNTINFKGYGKIRHQSVDVGVRYGYDWGCYGRLSIEYARRVHALNFPKNTNLVFLEYYLPLGTQVFTNY